MTCVSIQMYCIAAACLANTDMALAVSKLIPVFDVVTVIQQVFALSFVNTVLVVGAKMMNCDGPCQHMSENMS